MEVSKKPGGDILIIGYSDGSVELIIDWNFDRRMLVKYHDSHIGPISAATFNKDETFFITAGHDGLLNIF